MAFETIKQDWRGIVVQAVITAIIMVGLIWGLAIVLGSVAQDELAQRETAAIACILRIPPDERTVQDTDRCFQQYGIVIPPPSE